MQSIQQSAYEKLETATKIAICIPSFENKDALSSAIFLYKYIFRLNKEVKLFINGELTDEIKQRLDADKISYSNESKPVSYVITIDYGTSGIDKVTYDRNEKEGKLNFYITPTKGEFDFENIDFHEEGNGFDLTFTIDATSFKDLGSLYEGNRHLYSDIDVISIFKGSGTLGDFSITVPEESSLLYAVRTFVGDRIDTESAVEMLDSLVEIEPLLEGDVSKGFLSEAAELVDSGAVLQKAITKKYFNMNYPNLDLQIKLMHNVQVDRKSRVIWSKMSAEDMKFCNVDRGSLNTVGRIIFNISDAFDLAFAVYEVGKDTLRVIVESNEEKYSANNIAGVFGGAGDDTHAQFEVKDMLLKDFEKKVFLVLDDMYKLRVEGHAVEFRSAQDDSLSK